MIITILVFLLLLSILVLIHEFGHFWVAKKLGIKVEEFGFGFPPRAFSFKRGETVYSINWLPIGGFVKLYGEDEVGGGKISLEDPRKKITDISRAFFARPVKQRAAVVLAGVIMNAILAAVIFYIFLGMSNFKTEIPLLGNHKFFGVHQSTSSDIFVNGVSKNSPAEKARITIGSKIVSINGQKIHDVKQFVAIINQHRGEKVTITWRDVETNKESTAVVVPRVSPPKNDGALGVSFFPISIAVLEYKTPAEKLFSGIVHPINLMLYNFDILGKLIKISIQERTADPISRGAAGPIGIGFLVGSKINIPDVRERVMELLNLAGLLSISLAFFNVLPIPALDGGRLFFILIEGVTGHKVNPKIESYIHAAGMAVLLTLILLITINDINIHWQAISGFFLKLLHF